MSVPLNHARAPARRAAALDHQIVALAQHKADHLEEGHTLQQGLADLDAGGAGRPGDLLEPLAMGSEDFVADMGGRAATDAGGNPPQVASTALDHIDKRQPRVVELRGPDGPGQRNVAVAVVVEHGENGFEPLHAPLVLSGRPVSA